MDKYQALKEIWENGQVIMAEDSMGIKYKFAKINNQFSYTRVGIDTWTNGIPVTNFLTEFKNFTL